MCGCWGMVTIFSQVMWLLWLQEELQNEKQEEVMRLEKQYENTLRTVGQAHLRAKVTVSGWDLVL